mgnify:CR=1 FL=1
MNSKKSLTNILSNILRQVITLGLGIIIPRLVLVNLGSESSGLLNSINQILAYVTLLEAGVGTASLQALYGPIANKDHLSVNSIMAATNHFYKRTGTIYFLVVLFLSILFPLTLDTDLSYRSVALVVFFSGMPGVINYYFQGKFKILLQAEGKEYIVTNMMTIIQLATNISKIILLLNGFDVVALQFMYLVFSLIQMIYIALYMRRHYKWLNLGAVPNFEALSQSRHVVIHQISGLIFNHTDMLLLTYFRGLKTVSVYSMYQLFMGIVDTMISNFTGMTFALGQAFHQDRKHYMKLHDAFELYYTTLTFCLFCITNLFILPFMKLYTQGVQDINYIDEMLPYLFIGTFLISRSRTSCMHAINFAGHFRQTQWHAVVEAVLNLSVSVFGVSRWGIHGALLGTIVSLLFRSNSMILYASKHILKRSPWFIYRRWLLNLVLFTLVTMTGKWMLSFVSLDSYFSIIGWAIVACAVVIPLFFGVVSLAEREVFSTAMEILSPFLRKLHIGKHSV